ncbi:metalloregulator ArsR/SmtB family transcription factor [Actinomadura sp. K4S16]|uniref:helix-turn-helix transcriptional regulator n=1 Tax=Actinomadura sp. K4S16 TaxID=1316147 RepID=UPI0011EFC3BF|nr:helix-turn-helix domain-containing protein [Actinomadura sp. K4S16]
MPGFEQNVAGIGALAEPVRRALYLYVCAQAAPVSRDEAAEAVGVPRHQAKFHLDRLEAEGLLEADYARLTGRTGPGAGRTSKRYRRTSHDIAVSLPDRRYELAGRLMAEAITESARTGAPVLDTLHRVAAAHGMAIGSAVADGARTPPAEALDAALGALAEYGYEPRREGDRAVMANCPFHALARTHTELVCHMNHALINGLIDAVGAHEFEASLDPGEDRCCVTLTARPR